MKNIHIVIPDLFLPQQLASYASGDLSLPALEKLLARANSAPLHVDTLEAWLCEHFAVADMAIAPITVLADGVLPGKSYWLRADPVGFSMQRDQMVLQSDIDLSREEAAGLCDSLNAHFAQDGLKFLSPHPQRWYVQMDATPAMATHPLPQVVGANMHAHLPFGEDALRWHGVMNEIQMLFYEHPVNQLREQRGEAVVGGVWLWGGGHQSSDFLRPCAKARGDSELAHAFAEAAGIPSVVTTVALPDEWTEEGGDMLVVWEGLRSALQRADIGRWRNAVQQLEQNYAVPILAALAAGQVEQVTLDILAEGASRRFVLKRASLWKIWRLPKPLLHYALAQTAN